MIVAFLKQKGGVGKTTLPLHLAGEWSREGKSVILNHADPRGSALDSPSGAQDTASHGSSGGSAWRATRCTVGRQR